MIKLFWNTHYQKNPISTNKKIREKEESDYGWGQYHKRSSDKWIYEILKKTKYDIINGLNDLEKDHDALIGELVLVASALAKELGISDDGYRTNFNCNDAGGQTVYHIHLHLLGGRKFDWPPG